MMDEQLAMYEQSIMEESMDYEQSMLDEMGDQLAILDEMEHPLWTLDEMEDQQAVHDWRDFPASWPALDRKKKIREASPVLDDFPPMEELEAFSYTPLEHPEHQIRVVRLYPGVRPTNKALTCELETVDLRDFPEYECLSYEWGSTSSPCKIILNDHYVSVRKNLYWALYHLRDEKEPRTLWIDALCINQADLPEKNKQVSRMGDIYSKASKVLAWIGKEDEQTERAVSFLSGLLTWRSIEKYCPPRRACFSEDSHSYNWASLSKLCCRSYWSRLWIIQEVLLASDLHIQCGSHSFKWENLSNVFHYLAENSHSTVFCSPYGKHGIVTSVPFKLEMRRKEHRMAVLQDNCDDFIPLLDLVDLFKDAQCFDPRDKIFGLKSLGLLCCRRAVPTEYKDSVKYKDVLRQLWEHHVTRHCCGDYIEILHYDHFLNELTTNGYYICVEHRPSLNSSQSPYFSPFASSIISMLSKPSTFGPETTVAYGRSLAIKPLEIQRCLIIFLLDSTNGGWTLGCLSSII